jgi:hypothetical protein
MLDFRRLDGHHDAGGTAVGLGAPVMFPENAPSTYQIAERASIEPGITVKIIMARVFEWMFRTGKSQI